MDENMSGDILGGDILSEGENQEQGQESKGAALAPLTPALEQSQNQNPPPPAEYAPAGVDEATRAELSALGRELGLSQEQLQRITDYGAAKFGDGQEALRIAVAAKHDEWLKASSADPEIMNNISHAHRLVARFGNPEFKTMMNETGIGNNPAFIKFCIQAGRLLGEAPVVTGQKPAAPVSMLGALAGKYQGKM